MDMKSKLVNTLRKFLPDDKQFIFEIVNYISDFMDRLVQTVKFGGSMLAYSDRKPSIIDDLIGFPETYVRPKDELGRYAKETFEAWNDRSGELEYELWLFHGVKQYGHDVVSALGIVPEVRKYCKFLSDIIVEICRREGLPIEQIDLAETCKWNEKLKIFEVEEFLRQGRKVVESGGIPISYGTVVVKIPSGYAIMSGDDALLYTGLIRRANEAVMYLDVPVCDKDPKVHLDAKPLDILRSCKDLSTIVSERDKTGGLLGKIEKTRILAMSGTKCQLVDATKKGNIYHSLMGEVVGTLVEPEI